MLTCSCHAGGAAGAATGEAVILQHALFGWGLTCQVLQQRYVVALLLHGAACMAAVQPCAASYPSGAAWMPQALPRMLLALQVSVEEFICLAASVEQMAAAKQSGRRCLGGSPRKGLQVSACALLYRHSAQLQLLPCEASY